MNKSRASERFGQLADRITDRLAERPEIDAVMLYGSVARGDATDESDVDLFLIGSDAGQTIRSLRGLLGAVDPEQRAGLTFHTRESFAELVTVGSRFLVHLRREGRILLDRSGQLTGFVISDWSPRELESELTSELTRLENYDDPEIFGERLLFPLAHVFTIGKAVVMAKLAAEGDFEFNRGRAFRRFSVRYPAYLSEVEAVVRLEPYLAFTRRKSVALPMPPEGPGAVRLLGDGVGAIRRLASA